MDSAASQKCASFPRFEGNGVMYYKGAGKYIAKWVNGRAVEVFAGTAADDRLGSIRVLGHSGIQREQLGLLQG
jgi:hypothetical protein